MSGYKKQTYQNNNAKPKSFKLIFLVKVTEKLNES